jgi:hypothetical protein
MEGKKIILVFFAAAFLFSGYILYAQTSSPAQQPGYYVDNSSGQPVFKQRLVWEKEEYARNYEVVIDIFSGQYVEYYSEITEKTFIEISLHPGRYRYSVTPYDLLGRRGESSDWEEFSINTAYQPEIVKIVPNFFYMDQMADRVLTITGNNLFEDSVIYLRNGINDLVPINKVVTNNSSVRLTFDDEALVPGTYEIYIKNPGGLDAFFGGFFVGYHKKFEAFLKLGYNPVIPVSGGFYDMFGSYFYPLGVSLRLEALSSERASFKAGLGLGLSLYNLKFNDSMKSKSDEYNFNFSSDAEVSLFDVSINISFQSRFNHQRNAITFDLGFGLTTYTGSGFDDPYYYDDYGYGYGYNDNKNYINYNRSERNGHMNLCLSGLFLVYKVLYLETGIDLTYYLTGKSVLIKPRVGLAMRI